MTLLLHHLLRDAADQFGDGVAIRYRGSSLTYERLEQQANGVASALSELGVRPGDRVALYLPKRPEAIASLYGILKVGAAYVPLDPVAPVVHAAMAASDAGVAALITTPDRCSGLVEGLARSSVGALLVGESVPQSCGVPSITFEEATADPTPPDPGIPMSDTDLACLLYTSGSTGRPKGVMHTHRAALVASNWYADALRITSSDRLALHAPLHFILSAYAIYPAAIAGATSVLLPFEQGFRGRDLGGAVEDERVTVWISVPAPLRMMAAEAESRSLRSLRAVVVGGGALPGSDVQAIRNSMPDAELWHFYGATEAWGIFAHQLNGSYSDDGPVPIGYPQTGTEVLVLADDGSAAVQGQRGELYVRGPKVMLGYWGDPAATARSLVRDPLGGTLDEPMYRTGDLVRLLDDGTYAYVGRLDHMIKSRGYRVELAEIELALSAHEAVSDAAAIAIPHPDWGSAVIAFVEPHAGARPTSEELRGHLAARLPSYMLPVRIEVVDTLPRTSAGKVDRRRLRPVALEGAP